MKTESWMRRAVAILGVAALCAMAPAALLADDDAANAASEHGRAVRLSSVDGAVQVSQGTEVLADQALVNTPLFEGMTVTTGDDGRAEIQFEDGSVARVPPDGAVTLSVMRSGESELTLENGMGYFELQDGAQGKMRVRFASDVVTGSGFTVLRVKLDEGAGD
ncbi:MAG TPA: FecR domain-containing protein, partial [Terracidiphilus sp.]|nr:FecR domain-containing protein [Terracidiphilus sp.]